MTEILVSNFGLSPSSVSGQQDFFLVSSVGRSTVLFREDYHCLPTKEKIIKIFVSSDSRAAGILERLGTGAAATGGRLGSRKVCQDSWHFRWIWREYGRLQVVSNKYGTCTKHTYIF